MAWANQTLATIVLWAITIYLLRAHKLYIITLIPSVFMTAVVLTYIMVAPEGMSLPVNTGYIAGGAGTVVVTLLFIVFAFRREEAPK